MRPRRSRFSRIYHRITRRAPNRRKQWEQVATLRPHGSPGSPVSACTKMYAPYQPHEQTMIPSASIIEPAYGSLLSEPIESSSAPEPTDHGSVITLAVMVTWVFLLACAFAGYAGYMHSRKDAYALLGILGAVASLLTAAASLFIAAGPGGRTASNRFLLIGAVLLAAALGLLIYFSFPH
jgi:hypothetical protein